MCKSLFYYEPLTHTAPSAAPNSVSVSEVTSSSITVQWRSVRCIDRNGDITGYRIRAMTSGGDDRIVVDDVREATISGLSPSTEYTVSVAAVNSQDTGPYSAGIVQSTSGKLVSLRVEEF